MSLVLIILGVMLIILMFLALDFKTRDVYQFNEVEDNKGTRVKEYFIEFTPVLCSVTALLLVAVSFKEFIMK